MYFCCSIYSDLTGFQAESSKRLMAGTEDNSCTIEYWPPPNSGSRTLSNSSNDEFGSKSLSIFLAENGNVGPSWKSETQSMGPSTKAEEGEAGVNDSNEFSLQSKLFGAPISSSSGGLAERMATRKGFNVPKLDTAGIPPASMASHSDIHSPYLTIPPGLSPTMLLESPVFLADPMVRYHALNLLCIVMSFRRHSKKVGYMSIKLRSAIEEWQEEQSTGLLRSYGFGLGYMHLSMSFRSTFL